MKEVRVRVRSSKIEVRCESACGSVIEVRVCVRHTAKFLATQRLEKSPNFSERQIKLGQLLIWGLLRIYMKYKKGFGSIVILN